MKLKDILSEGDLRQWLRTQAPRVGIDLQWVEPALYGSSVGAPDVIMKHSVDVPISIELKILLQMKKGIKFTLRPAQRRWHHMGKKYSALLFVELNTVNKLWLVRGDKIPLRDYASHKDSGCKDGICDMWIINRVDTFSDESVMRYLKFLLFGVESHFWIGE